MTAQTRYAGHRRPMASRMAHDTTSTQRGRQWAVERPLRWWWLAMKVVAGVAYFVALGINDVRF